MRFSFCFVVLLVAFAGYGQNPRVLRTQPDSAAAMAEIKTLFANYQVKVEANFSELKSETGEKISELNIQIKELEDQIKDTRDMIAKLQLVLTELEKEKAKNQKSIAGQKEQALKLAAQLAHQKKWEELNNLLSQLRSQFGNSARDAKLKEQ